jgi:hypothetical protein
VKKLALALLLVCCFWSTYLWAEENQPTKKFASGIFSLGGGGFFPGGDLNSDFYNSTYTSFNSGKGFDTGYNVTFSGGATLGRFLGVGIDVSYRQAEQKYITGYAFTYNNQTNTLRTGGLEYLAYFQPNDWRVQPYIAVGFGSYFNNLDTWQSMELDNGFGFGYGVVAKAGIRFFITEHFFLGGYAKYFTDWTTYKIYYINNYGNSYSDNKIIDLGGLVANFELGVKF